MTPISVTRNGDFTIETYEDKIVTIDNRFGGITITPRKRVENEQVQQELKPNPKPKNEIIDKSCKADKFRMPILYPELFEEEGI